MKTGIQVLLLIILPLSLAAQKQDSLATKPAIKATYFDILFSYYEQDGVHSAVTGGRGTEKLQVYLNKLTVTTVLDSANTLFFEGGIDVISSASTDNIDYNVSSASATDNRLWVTVGYEYTLRNKRQVIGGKPSFSMESDYLSLGLSAWWNGSNQLKNWRYTVSAQFFADDLRWGRLNKRYRKPVTVVYPVELRDSAWYDIYRRYSYNLNFDIQHDINRRMSIGFFPGIIYQHGLLATPFHRFYFAGASSAVVERLPENRLKIPLGIQLNSFIGARTIMQLYYRFYFDNFGIKAHTISLSTPVRLTPQFTFTPFIRFYQQASAKYFFPYQVAASTETYYTSDYDLSRFTSYKLGAALKFIFIKNIFIKQFNLRYAYYTRSDGLYFNQISSYFNLGGS